MQFLYNEHSVVGDSNHLNALLYIYGVFPTLFYAHSILMTFNTVICLPLNTCCCVLSSFSGWELYVAELGGIKPGLEGLHCNMVIGLGSKFEV